MNKSDLYKAVSSNSGVSQQTVREVCETLFGVIASQISQDENVKIQGFGTFKRSSRKARIGTNPRTRTPIEIKSSFSVSFRAGKVLKRTLSNE